MNDPQDRYQPPMKTGWWLYDGTVRCRVEIVLRDVWPDDSRLEDGEEVWEDRAMPCFELIYESPVGGGLCDQGPHFATFDEAIRGADKLFGSRLTWNAE